MTAKGSGLRRTLLAIGPVGFSLTLWVRGLSGPTGFDATISAVAAAVTVASLFALTDRRWAGAVVATLPLVVVASPAGTELAFSLAAYDSAPWRVHAVATLVLLGLACATGLTVAFRQDPPVVAVVPIGVAAGAGLIALVAAVFPQPAFGSDLSDDERAELPIIELVSYGYDVGNLPTRVGAPFAAVLRNVSDLPHTFTVAGEALEVYVPAGREAVVEVDATTGALLVYCTIGDHRDVGMQTTIQLS